MNSSEVLAKLRSTYRVRQPSHVHHPLLRAARRRLGIPVYHYRRPPKALLPAVGSAPNDSFYEGGAIYVGPKDAKRRTGLWHELCHALVAEQKGKLHFTNFRSSGPEEVDSCHLEFWLGFMSGYTSLQEVLRNIARFGFSQDLEWGLEESYRDRDARTWFTYQSVRVFFLSCRETALRYAGACRVARQLKVYSKRDLLRKLDQAWNA